MRVVLRLYGDLSKYAIRQKPAEWEGDIPENATVEEAIRIMGCQQGEVISVLRDDRYIKRSQNLREGDYLHLLSHLGGG